MMDGGKKIFSQEGIAEALPILQLIQNTVAFSHDDVQSVYEFEDDCTEAVPLLKLLPDLKDCDILADKAYGTKEIRTYLHNQSASYTIPPKVNTKQPWPFNKKTYKRRNAIERFFNRLKEFRRAETRCDKRDDSFLAFVMVAASCVAFSILHI